MFLGTLSVKMDERGRLKVPTLVKERFDLKYGKNATYFLTSLTGASLLVYPIPEWQRLLKTLARAPQFDKLKRKFLMMANHYGEEADMDEQGRLLVPARLREEAGMKGDVKLTWQSNHVEALNADAYEKGIEENRLTPEEFDNLAKLGI